MAIFKKNDSSATQRPRERPISVSRGVSADGAISIIGFGMSVVGDITTEGIVRVEGQVRGTIRAGKSLILGQAGSIEGDVYTEDAVIGGAVTGTIVATSRLELQATSTVQGEIRTRAEHLKLEEGARFAGQVHMLEADSTSGDTTLDFGGASGSAAASPVESYSWEEPTPVAEELGEAGDSGFSDASSSPTEESSGKRKKA